MASSFSKVGIATPCMLEQPIKGMELQENKAEED